MGGKIQILVSLYCNNNTKYSHVFKSKRPVNFIYSEKAIKFDWQYIGQIIDGDFAKFCGLLRIYEL